MAFQLPSGRIIITDPSTDVNGNAQVILENAFIGKWTTFLQPFHDHTGMLFSAHADEASIDNLRSENCSDINSHSGCVGMFDYDRYEEHFKINVEETRRSIMINRCLHSWDCTAGIVAFSKYNYGRFQSIVQRNNTGSIVAAHVFFTDDFVVI